MAKEIRIKVGVKSNVIPVKVGIGQTVERIVAPEVYKGEYNIKPTGEDIIIPTKDKMLTDDLTILGEEWDGILYPADEEGRFNCKWLYLEAGDKVIVEWYGRGNRVWAFRSGAGGIYNANNRGSNASNMGYNPKDYYQNYCMTHIRYELNPVEGKTIFVAAGYEWSDDGGHSANDSYVFFGEYYKYKVIHAS